MSYQKNKVSEYWSKRVASKPDISAVLNIGLPNAANLAFDNWFFYFLRKFLRKDTKILDAACGLGRVLVPLSGEGYDITGLDLSKEMLRICRSNLDKVGIEQKVVLISGSVNNLPFKNGEFDLVILSEILFHLPDEVCRKAIGECSRVLKQGGLAVVTTNNKRSIFLKSVFDRNQSGYFFKIRDVEDISNLFHDLGLIEIFRRANSFTSVLNYICKIPKVGNVLFFLDKRFPLILRVLYNPVVFLDKFKQPSYVSGNLATLFFLVFEKRKANIGSGL